MDILNIAVKDQSIIDKIIELLEPLKNEGVEIIDNYKISKEDLADIKAILATKGEETVSLDEFLKL